VPWKSKKNVPKSLSNLTLDQANEWGKHFDKFKKDGKGPSFAAGYAWREFKKKYKKDPESGKWVKKKNVKESREDIDFILYEYSDSFKDNPPRIVEEPIEEENEEEEEEEEESIEEHLEGQLAESLDAYLKKAVQRIGFKLIRNSYGTKTFADEYTRRKLKLRISWDVDRTKSRPDVANLVFVLSLHSATDRKTQVIWEYYVGKAKNFVEIDNAISEADKNLKAFLGGIGFS